MKCYRESWCSISLLELRTRETFNSTIRAMRALLSKKINKISATEKGLPETAIYSRSRLPTSLFAVQILIALIRRHSIYFTLSLPKRTNQIFASEI